MENLSCLIQNFPLDIFLALLLPLLLLWWYLSRVANRYKAHASELQDRINFLEGELEACRKNRIIDHSGNETANLRAEISRLQSELDLCRKGASDLDLGVVASGAGLTAPIAALTDSEIIKKDDLKIVEGIGPKIEELCHVAGIYTFADLADASYETLKGILDNAGARFQMHDPSTWPKQAALARDGKWDELKAWQDELNKGKE